MGEQESPSFMRHPTILAIWALFVLAALSEEQEQTSIEQQNENLQATVLRLEQQIEDLRGRPGTMMGEAKSTVLERMVAEQAKCKDVDLVCPQQVDGKVTGKVASVKTILGVRTAPTSTEASPPDTTLNVAESRKVQERLDKSRNLAFTLVAQRKAKMLQVEKGKQNIAKGKQIIAKGKQDIAKGQQNIVDSEKNLKKAELGAKEFVQKKRTYYADTLASYRRSRRRRRNNGELNRMKNAEQAVMKANQDMSAKIQAQTKAAKAIQQENNERNVGIESNSKQIESNSKGIESNLKGIENNLKQDRIKNTCDIKLGDQVRIVAFDTTGEAQKNVALRLRKENDSSQKTSTRRLLGRGKRRRRSKTTKAPTRAPTKAPTSNKDVSQKMSATLKKGNGRLTKGNRRRTKQIEDVQKEIEDGGTALQSRHALQHALQHQHHTHTRKGSASWTRVKRF